MKFVLRMFLTVTFPIWGLFYIWWMIIENIAELHEVRKNK